MLYMYVVDVPQEAAKLQAARWGQMPPSAQEAFNNAVQKKQYS